MDKMSEVKCHGIANCALQQIFPSAQEPFHLRLGVSRTEFKLIQEYTTSQYYNVWLRHACRIFLVIAIIIMIVVIIIVVIIAVLFAVYYHDSYDHYL